MSIRSQPRATPAAETTGVAALEAAATDLALAEGASFAIASADSPLTRNIVVSIRASLDSLCKSDSAATWSPSSEALKSIFQQKKFVSLEGTAETQGDLKSVVLHELSVDNVVSSFPIAVHFRCSTDPFTATHEPRLLTCVFAPQVGAKITGVDSNTFASSGESFSMISLPNTNSSTRKVLQADDVSLAYELQALRPPLPALATPATFNHHPVSRAAPRSSRA